MEPNASESTVHFITGNDDHNREVLDQLTGTLQSEFPGMTVVASQQVTDGRARVRFSLTPLLAFQGDENRPDFNLGIVDVAADQDVNIDAVIGTARTEMMRYSTER